MNILAFGVLAEIMGGFVVQVEPARDTDTLRSRLSQQFPTLQKYPFQVAVNRQRVAGNTLLNESDEIALLPPFAGG
jgi:molybdopterin synthase sulfur carrier subunit